MAEPRNQFTFYRSYFDMVQGFSKKIQAETMLALIAYAIYEIEPENLSAIASGLFTATRPVLDSSRKKSEKLRSSSRKPRGNLEETPRENKIEKELEIEIESELETEIDCSESEKPQRSDSVWLGFEKFWNLYPIKIAQDEAWEQWQKASPDTEAVCNSLQKWKTTAQWQNENGRYIPRAAKFLEQAYYLHAPDVVPMGASGRLGAAELEAIERIMRE